MILWASRRRIGTNLIVNIIIIAKSLTGILKRLRGDNTRFRAVVSSSGVVVRVNMDDKTIMRRILNVITIPLITPSKVIFINQMGKGLMEVPGVKKKWAKAAKRKSQTNGIIPFMTYPKGILDDLMINRTTSPIKRNFNGASIKKRVIIRRIKAINFTLGSNPCMNESWGIY